MLKPMLYSARNYLRKVIQIIILAGCNFFKDDCYTKASTLTFYTLQSIVPFLAAVFAIAKGFGFDDYLENLIKTTFQEQKEILNYAIQIALSTLKYIRSGELVGFGALFLIWTNVNLIGYIERVFNEIWKIKNSRGIIQKIKDFSLILLVFPLVFVTSSSATVYFKTQISTINSNIIVIPFNYFYFEFFRFLPLLLSWVLFFMLYFFIPNTRIKIFSRIVASVLAGTVFQLWQLIYINFQFKIFSYNVVYGAFAVLPLFLVWSQLSWLIVLAGAEIAATIENYTYSDFKISEGDLVKINVLELTLLILHECFKTFYSGTQPLSSLQIAERLKVSQNSVQEILELLEREKILSLNAVHTGDFFYQPLYDPGLIKIKKICEIIQRGVDHGFLVKNSEILQKIKVQLEGMDNLMEESTLNVKLNMLL